MVKITILLTDRLSWRVRIAWFCLLSRREVENFVFLRKIKIFGGKNNVTFLVLLRAAYMQKMSELIF